MSMTTSSLTPAPKPKLRSLALAGIAGLFGAAVPGCVEADPRDLGLTQNTEDLSVTEPTATFTTPATEFVGRWVGEAEDALAFSNEGEAPVYRFPSGSTRIEVEISIGEDGFPTALITFGEGAPLPQVVDPDVGYPPGVDYTQLLGYADPELPDYYHQYYSRLPPFEGFPYAAGSIGALLNDALPDGVLTLSFGTAEPLDPWCQMQEPIALSNFSGYGCGADYSGWFGLEGDDGSTICYAENSGALCEALLPSAEDCEDINSPSCDFSAYEACEFENSTELDCARLDMCINNLCSCTAEGCAAPRGEDRLSLRRVGDELIGVFDNTVFKNARGFNVPVGEVRLRLQP